MYVRITVISFVAFSFVMALAVFTISPAFAVTGSDRAPGEACSNEDAVTMTANPTGSGGYILTCESSVWVATISGATPIANEHLTTKAYVDTAVAAGGIGACVDNDAALCALETSRSSDDPEFTAANIKSGINILGVTGTLTAASPDCTNDSAVTCTLEATRVNDDAQFTAANIASGVNILGVTGTLSGGLAGPSGCVNIGDQCADSTIFAGWHPVTQTQLFLHPNNQSVGIAWSTETVTTGVTNDSDGKANHDWIVANKTIATYPAFKLCDDLNIASALGHTDWYLPSRVELYYFWLHQTAINAGLGDAFIATYYWSSTEFNSSIAWCQSFSNGYQNYLSKTGGNYVRCLRR